MPEDDCVQYRRCAEIRGQCDKLQEERSRHYSAEIGSLREVVTRSFSSLSELIRDMQDSIPSREQIEAIVNSVSSSMKCREQMSSAAQSTMSSADGQEVIRKIANDALSSPENQKIIKALVSEQVSSIEFRDVMRGVVTIPTLILLLAYTLAAAGMWFSTKNEIHSLQEKNAEQKQRIERLEEKKGH